MILKSHIRQLGWIALLAICLGLFFALSFRVHAVKSEVQLAEREIIALERQTRMLETEFQTRASQRQLASWNVVEFGYLAPRADQYLENERQLASLGSEARPDAPAPIRVARSSFDKAGSPDAKPFADIAMVSPITGKPVTLSVAASAREETTVGENIGALLAQASPIKPARAAGGSSLPEASSQGDAE